LSCQEFVFQEFVFPEFVFQEFVFQEFVMAPNLFQSLGAINQIIQENESCPLGFKLSQGECIDINECQAGTNDCMDSQRCENTIGSFICVR